MMKSKNVYTLTLLKKHRNNKNWNKVKIYICFL